MCTATGCQPNFSWQIYHIIYHKSRKSTKEGLVCRLNSGNACNFLVLYHLFSSLLSTSIKIKLHKIVTLPVGLYLLTPWNRVLLENLTGSQLVKKFPAFYGTRRFITAFTWFEFVGLCGCDDWFVTLWEENRLRVFEIRMLRKILGPKRDEFTGNWRELRNEKLRNF
jgi:hypothetical protein